MKWEEEEGIQNGKHLQVRLLFLRELHFKKALRVTHVPSEDMTADILTKGLPQELHDKHCHSLGLDRGKSTQSTAPGNEGEC